MLTKMMALELGPYKVNHQHTCMCYRIGLSGAENILCQVDQLIKNV